MSKLNLLLVAEESAGIQLLRAVQQLEHNLVAVLASPAKETLEGATVWNVATKLGYPTWPAHLVKDPAFAEHIREAEIDLLLNVHSLYIIADEVLYAPRIGSFNLHPGPLPEYAGLNAVSWALYHGEDNFGVTLHQMVSKIDAGSIVAQRRFAIEDGDSALSLVARCVKLGIPLVLELIEQAARGGEMLPLEPQDLAGYRYFGSRIPNSGCLDWTKTARDVIGFIRACDYYPFPSPWGQPRARLFGDEVSIIKAALTGEACEAFPGSVRVDDRGVVYAACRDEWIRLIKMKANGSYCDAGAVQTNGSILENGY